MIVRQKISNIKNSYKYLLDSFYKKRTLSLYEDIFFQDFCANFSIVLGSRYDYRNFFKIEEDDSSLKSLIEHENYRFLEYDFDKILINNLANLLMYGKAYVEVVKVFDADNNLVGIKILSLKNSIKLPFGNKIYCLFKKYNGKIEKRIIDKNDMIIFKVHDLGYTRGYFRRMLRKLRKLDALFFASLRDSKYGLDDDVYKKKKDLELLKVGHKLGWSGRNYDSYYTNEPYLIYLKMQELKIKEKILNKLLRKYNKKLLEIGKKYGFEGKICYETRLLKIDDLYKELAEGKKNCEQVSNEIYKW